MINPKSLENLKPATKENAAERGSKGGKNKLGKKHVSTWIDEMLHDEEFKATIRQGLNITEYKGAPIKAIIGAQLALAASGDVKAADLLFKYGYGLKQTIEHQGAVPVADVDPETAAAFADFLKSKTKD